MKNWLYEFLHMHGTRMTVLRFVALLAATTTAEDIHVSSHLGDNGTGDGSSAHPYSSLHAAQTAVRSLLQRWDVTHTSNITVHVQAGHYFNHSITLTEADSPRAGSNARVTWRGEQGATVYGGARILGWTRAPAAIGASVWQARLSQELVDHAGRARFRTLVHGERSAWLARQPNFGSGFLTGCSWNGAGFTCSEGVLPPTFDCVVTDAGLPNATSACSVFARSGYSSDIRPVVGVNHSARSVAVDPLNSGRDRGMYYLQGPLELLDQEGEWAVRAGVLYYWPYTAAGGAPTDPNDAIITAPVVQRVFSFVGADRRTPATGVTVRLFFAHFVQTRTVTLALSLLTLALSRVCLLTFSWNILSYLPISFASFCSLPFSRAFSRIFPLSPTGGRAQHHRLKHAAPVHFHVPRRWNERNEWQRRKLRRTGRPGQFR